MVDFVSRLLCCELFVTLTHPTYPHFTQKFLGARIPGSFLSYHENTLEFRQTHVLPERQKEGEVIVLSPVQVRR